jgi:tRNA pseudouridine55 synthase
MTQDQDRILLIDKPLRWTSFDVIRKLRGILKIKKIGHAGTLDPLATGLLIVCTGKMTKSISSFQAMEKEYQGVLVLGQTTPSDDLETMPTDPVDIHAIGESQIHHVAQQFLGTIQQSPPLHSAIKVNGTRAYELARVGSEKKLDARSVVIHRFEITRIENEKVSFQVTCSKGTYIRSLVRDFGAALKVGAYLAELRRTRIGNYSLNQAQTIDQLIASTATL